MRLTKEGNNMSVTCLGWKNKQGTSSRSCQCGSWKQHWINFSNKKWPLLCCVSGCMNEAILGAHIYNPKVSGERIIPACDLCNKKTNEFSLKVDTILVSANKQKTCEK